MGFNEILQTDTSQMTPDQVVRVMHDYMFEIYKSYDEFKKTRFVNIKDERRRRTYWSINTGMNSTDNSFLAKTYKNEFMKNLSQIVVECIDTSSSKDFYSIDGERQNAFGYYRNENRLNSMARTFDTSSYLDDLNKTVINYYNGCVEPQKQITDEATLEKINVLQRMLKKVYIMKEHSEDDNQLFKPIFQYHMGKDLTMYRMTDRKLGITLNTNGKAETRYMRADPDFLLTSGYIVDNAFALIHVPNENDKPHLDIV